MYQITKVAPNNVELRCSRAVESVDKSLVEAFIDPPESYGEIRVRDELAALQAKRDSINAFDKKAELAKLQEKEDMLREIETALTGDTLPA